MRVLIVGSGGREHALAWKLSQEAEVFATPGNPGIAQVATLFDASMDELPCKALALKPDFVIVGPENPLVDGLADKLRAAGLVVFGPNADGARHEGSKAFSKELMAAAGVPTAKAVTCHTAEEAKKAIEKFSAEGMQVAVKASGAALGKGVVVCSTREEALDAVEMMMVDRELGDAGDTVVIEERLRCREFSLIAVCSGTSFVSMPIAQDYKRALDNDRGPNTGGMGTYSPVPWIRDAIVSEAEERVIAPMLREMRSRGIDYRGVLFAGLMVDGDRIDCLEYNVRFGDPEIQSIVRRIGTGFGDLLLAAAKGEALEGRTPEVLNNAAVTVVMASNGYPGSYAKGKPIGIPAPVDGVVYFHAGTASGDSGLVTSGGRVLAVSGAAENLESARALAYRGCEAVVFPDGFCRRDIALVTS